MISTIALVVLGTLDIYTKWVFLKRIRTLEAQQRGLSKLDELGYATVRHAEMIENLNKAVARQTAAAKKAVADKKRGNR